MHSLALAKLLARAQTFDEWATVASHQPETINHELRQMEATALTFQEWKRLHWRASNTPTGTDRTLARRITANAIVHLQKTASTFEEWIEVWNLPEDRTITRTPTVLSHLQGLAQTFWDWFNIAYSTSDDELIREIVSERLKPLAKGEDELKAVAFFTANGY